MPIGNVSREAPKKEAYRPPWVKDKDSDAPPAWTQRKLKPVEPKEPPKAAPAEPTPAVKTLKPTLKKQSTIKDKPENGVSEVEEKLVKPSAAKLADRGKASEERSKFAKSALKSIETIPKLEDKLSLKDKNTAKAPEKPTLRSVRTIDDKTKEKSVTIVDKKAEKNGPTKNGVNDKPLSKTNTLTNDKAPTKNSTTPIENQEKPQLKSNNTLNKSTVNDKAINDKSVSNTAKDNKTVTKVTEKPKVEKKEEDKSKMATKPPTPMDKKLPPRKPSLSKQPSKDDAPVKKWRDPLIERKKENIDKTLANDIPKGHTLTKNESLRSLLKPTPPPMPPPLPPKIPPPPEFKKAPLDPEKLKKIEQLRSRPRRRPDWSDMMKEVEGGKKLRKVVCNDRSSPIITTEVVKNKGQFIFESEQPTSHNELLKEINKGIKLKKTKTNDRSKPNLEGLRKFRRQMTIEEQVQKSMSQANLAASPSGASVAEMIPPEEEEIDEMDDIDKVRDDLQSTKQLLAIELRNKEAQERENKRLLTRIQNLEAELARERAIIKQEQHKTVISVTDAYDERLVNNLKAEVERTKENADSLEKKYLDAAEARDDALAELEEVKRKNSELERKLELALANQAEDMYISEEPLSFYQKRQLEFERQCRLLGMDPSSAEAYNMRKRNAAAAAANNNASNAAFTNRHFECDEGIMPTNPGSRRSSHAIRTQLSVTKDDSFEEEPDSEPEEEESEEKKQKRLEKEVKNMRNKIRHLKEKQDNMKRERIGFKMSLKNQQAALKDEKKKYKELKREVDKMAAMMKEAGSDDDDDDEDEDESEESKKSESEEEETETETEQDTESETESESEPEDAPVIKKKENLTTRLKRHEGRVNALKKGNALLNANVDRLKDDVLKQREESAALKKELDSLVEDL